MLYFADSQWWRWHKDSPAFKAFAGIRVTIEPTGMEIDDGEVHMLRNADGPNPLQRPALSHDIGSLATGRNSGHQAINLAVLLGARRIVLIGYDGGARGGKTHWFGDHPVPTAAAQLATYANNFRTLVGPLKKLGVEVINASPGSAIDAFPKMELCAALTA